MGNISLDPEIQLWRAIAFPFFDHIEIVFSLAIISVECVLLLFVHVANGWVIPVGSYLGMVGVAWTVLPSKAEVERDEIAQLQRIIRALEMIEITPGRFAPNLPGYLRWPRNVVEIGTGAQPTLSGPRGLLININQSLSNVDGD